MSRPSRIDFPGARHHVMNRGARREPIFRSDNDCASFIGLVAQLPERFGIRVHGFGLMPNHFHLMIESMRGNLSRAMADLLGRFTQEVNRAHGWDGPLFRGRFRNRVVLREEHWMHLLAYIHLNPVRAHLVVTPDQARWVSHPYYCGTHPPPDWLTVSELLAMVGGAEGYREQLRELQMGRIGNPEGFDVVAFERGKTISDEAGRLDDEGVAEAEVPPEQALREVMLVTGASLDTLRTPHRGRHGNPARAVAVFWLVDRCHVTQSEAGRVISMRESDVSKTLQRLRSRMAADDGLARTIEALRHLKARKMENGKA